MSQPGTQLPPLRILQVIWSALLISIGLYLFVSWMAVSGRQPAGKPIADHMADPIILVLAAAAAATLILAFILPRFMLRRPAAGTPGRAADPRPQARQTFIIQWALLESVAIYGLVATFYKQDLRLFLIFGAVALAGMLISFPSESRIQRMMRPG